MGFPNSQSNPAGAIPVYMAGAPGSLPLSDASASLEANTPLEVLSANPARRYLFIQCVTAGLAIWVNVLGDDAGANSPGSFQLTAGQTYESGAVVPPGPVSILCASNADVTVMEG